MLSLRFLVYWPLLLIVDQLSRIGYSPHPTELRRLYSENLALKAINESLRKELHRARNKRAPMSVATHANQVLAYLLTRGNKLFTDSFLDSSPATVKTWATQLFDIQRRGNQFVLRDKRHGWIGPSNVSLCEVMDSLASRTGVLYLASD